MIKTLGPSHLNRTADGPLGLLGGTFDPIHNGHLLLALTALGCLDLSEVWLIPAGMPPHRSKPVASAEQRLCMAQLAAADYPKIRVDDGEVKRAVCGQPSYTVETLRRLRQIFPERPLIWLIGADAFSALDAWQEWQVLFDLAHFAVVCRPGYVLSEEYAGTSLQSEWSQRRVGSPIELHSARAGRIYHMEMFPTAISATAIRSLFLYKGVLDPALKAMLPQPVLEYCRQNALYVGASN